MIHLAHPAFSPYHSDQFGLDDGPAAAVQTTVKGIRSIPIFSRKERRMEPLVIFGLYLALIFIFPFVYRALDNSGHTPSFMVPREIATLAGRLRKVDLQHDLRSTEALRDAFLDARSAASTIPDWHPNTVTIPLSNGRRVAFQRSAPKSQRDERFDLHTTLSDAETHSHELHTFPRSATHAANILGVLSTGCDEHITALREQIAALPDPVDPHQKHDWGLGVYIYYSASTQTTLGFGDVLPMTPTAKTITMVQVVIGLTLTVIVIPLLEPVAEDISKLLTHLL